MLDKIKRIGKPNTVPQLRFQFQVHTDPVSRILQASQIQIGYTEPLFPPFDLQIKRGEKIAIVGHNGIGKTTMLKTLLGYVKPLGGAVCAGERVKPAYFAQEELAVELTPLEQVWSDRPDMTQKEIRQSLARCGLKKIIFASRFVS